MTNFDLSLFHHALINASQFINDAQILLDNGSSGHAYGLSVLAFEEFGKALLGFNCYLGVLNRNDNDFKNEFTNHVSKQITAFQLISFMVSSEHLETSIFRDQLLKLISDYSTGKISVHRYNQDFLKILEDDPSDLANNLWELIEIEAKFEANPRWLDQRKQRALYIDVDYDKNIILSPQDEYEFTRDNVQLVINSHKWFIEYWRAIDSELRSNNKLPKEFVQYRSMVKQFMKSFNLIDPN